MNEAGSKAKKPALFVMKFQRALHDRSAFSCGFQPIDNFLKSSITDQIKNNLVTVWVAVENNTDKSPVKGFYALNAHSISSNDLPELTGKSRRETIPAIYINAVAVDHTFQGQGVGTALMIHAIQKSVEFSAQIGCAVIVLDLLNDGSEDAIQRRTTFYQTLGFNWMKNSDQPNRMYLSIKNAKASL